MSGEACLLLRLEGPLQSWGYRSRFKDRDTGTEPTKSGVVGLLCCALGRDRSESVDDLARLRMHVRVDQEGVLLTDFHTAGGGTFRASEQYFAPTSAGGKGRNPIITERHYLQDASFLVALEGDRALLLALAKALQDPVWPLSLGRRSCPPSFPVAVGIREVDFLSALGAEPLTELRRSPEEPTKRRLVRELPQGSFDGDPRQDVPVAWPDRQNRRYAIRYVRSEEVEVRP